MTGHHHDKQSRGSNPLRIETPTLNQQVANLAAARTEDNPYVRDLAKIEPKFIAELLRRLDTPGADHATIGAVLLAAGQLAGQIVEMILPDAKQHAAPMLTNLLQLAGQQLYMGKLTHATPCPYPYPTGQPCDYLGKADTADQLDAVMRGHIALHHPDQTWPCQHPERILLELDHATCTSCGDKLPVAPDDDWPITKNERAPEAQHRCRVYWGSHGCKHPHNHGSEIPHECDCCECTQHPDPDSGCVAKPPYYGDHTRFYGEDAEALGLPLVKDRAAPRAHSYPVGGPLPTVEVVLWAEHWHEDNGSIIGVMRCRAAHELKLPDRLAGPWSYEHANCQPKQPDGTDG